MKINFKITLIALLIIFLTVVGIILFFFFKNEKKSIKLFGNVEIRQVNLSFEVDGRIKEVFFEEGDFVKKGELLACLDEKDFLSKYKKAYFEAISKNAKMKDDILKYQRNYPLCKDGIISKQECDTLLNNKNSASADFKLSLAQRDFDKNQLEHTFLYSPSEGIISTRSEEKGARVSKGQIVYVLNLKEPIWIRTYISENDFGNIKYGSKAKVLTDSTDPNTNKKREYEGYVGYISPVAEFSPKIVQSEELRSDLVYRIRVYIKNPDEFIKQGMPTTIMFDLNNKEKENGQLCNRQKFIQKIRQRKCAFGYKF